MKEKALRFGKTATLIGVLTEPRQGTDPALPAVLLLNSGLLHRVGASRLHVQISRNLAEDGITSMRFDFSGVGDSEARRDSLPFEKSAVIEVQEAMDYLSTAKSSRHFVLMGLCSGADAAFLTAVADSRVVGVLQLDPWAYRTWKFYVRYYCPKLLNSTSWKNLFAGKTYVGPWIREMVGKKKGAAPIDENVVVSPYAREFPPKANVEAGLKALLARGVCMLNIFSGSMPEHYNYQSQYEESFRHINFEGKVRVEYQHDASHVFSGLAHQQFVVNGARRWMIELVRSMPARRIAKTLSLLIHSQTLWPIAELLSSAGIPDWSGPMGLK